jgi:dTDP-4-amino-4,6-dideoxygalactose transaminase
MKPGAQSTKDHLDTLAIFGAAPAFTEKLHVGRPNIGNRERLLERINGMLDRKWLTNNGPLVQEFEERIAALIGVKHCIAVCNATIGLEIATRAAGMQGEVIVPSFTFIATAHALQWQQITPVFCDIDPRTHNLDPVRVEQLITPRTSGIIGVHVWGRGCAIEELTAIAQQHHLRLMFDAAHAFGCSFRGRMLGSFGDAEVFSFHATKFFNTFEGGAIVTNDDDLAAAMRLMKNFGFAGYDNVISLGTNGKMNEAAAAMGLTGLESLDDFIAINQRNYQLYRRELADIPGITLVTYDEAERSNYQYIVLEVDEAAAQVRRDQFVDILWAEQVLARRYFYPGCHCMEPYRSAFPHTRLLLPETERLSGRVLLLPTGSTIDAERIQTICQIIRLAVNHSHELQERWT